MAKLTYRYHHLGIPTNDKHPDEVYLEKFKFFVSGYKESPYKVEWMRFMPGSPIPELVQKIPHVAFVVNNLKTALKGKQIIIEPNSPSKGLTVAFIVDNGAPIELMQFDSKEDEI